MRSRQDQDEAVAGIVAAILLTATFVGFLAAVNLNWIPAWVTNAEAAHSAELREDMGDWATAAEDHVARGLLQRAFSRSLSVGQDGLAVFGAGKSQGTLAVEPGLTLTVRHDGNVVATASGALTAATGSTRFPAQSFRYTLGGLEADQGDARFVDLRNLFTAQRTSGGALAVTVQAVSITGPAQSVGGDDVTAVGTLVANSTQTRGPGTVRLVIEGAGAAAWRGSAERVLGAAALSGESAANCAASTKNYCLDAATNDADTMDLWLLNVADGWTLTTGSVRAEVRT